MPFLRSEEGQGLLEYLLIIVLVAIVVIALLLLLAPSSETLSPDSAEGRPAGRFPSPAFDGIIESGVTAWPSSRAHHTSKQVTT